MAQERTDGQVEPSPAPAPASGRRRRTAAVLVLAGAAVLVVGLLGFWRLWQGRPPAVVENFRAGALDDYLPGDAAAVLALNLRSLLETPVGRRSLKEPLTQVVRRGTAAHPWMGLLGVDPLADLDRIEVAFSAGDLGRPLWLARGRFDRARFQTGPGQLREEVEDHFRVYRYSDPQTGNVMTLAVAGNTLVACQVRARVLDALRDAASPGREGGEPPALRALSREVDRRQTLWLAVSFKQLGPIGRLTVGGFEGTLRPVFDQSESVQGGLTCGEDLRAEFHFRARTEKGAQQLERDLFDRCELARGLLDLPSGFPLPLNIDPDLLPLFKLVGTGEVSRDGRDVRLRCRLAGEQLGGG
jgi:hypothetical protein